MAPERVHHPQIHPQDIRRNFGTLRRQTNVKTREIHYLFYERSPDVLLNSP